MTELDAIAPRWNFSIRHSRWVDAPPAQAAQALLGLRDDEIRLSGFLMAIRELPSRLAGKARLHQDGLPMLKSMGSLGFTVLSSPSGLEHYFFQAGKPWHPALEAPHPWARDRIGFMAFTQPGYAKIAVNFMIQADGRGSRVSTETRVTCTSFGARWRFALYWCLIRVPSGLIRRSILAALARRVRHWR